MPEAVKKFDCTKAEELLNHLGRENPLWGGTRQFWVFRGHSDDKKYKLIPNALRNKPQAMLGYTFAPKKGVQPTNQKQIDAEFERLHEFYWSIDAQGLHIPGECNLLRTPKGWQKLKKNINKDGWPTDDLLALQALAQHYGVPTRLLDWSDKPFVAAYFAAKGAIKKNGSDFLSIWAMNLDWIIHKAFPGKSEMSVYVVTAPRSSNPNLHAQGGIFTTENLPQKDLLNAVKIQTVDTIVEKKWKSLKCSVPVMAHLKLPCSEASKLLRLLNQEGINSATLFPGYQGVADSLSERESWDISERATYWMNKGKQSGTGRA